MRTELDYDMLESIALGLARTAPTHDHEWTEGARRRYTCLLETDLFDAWLISWSPSSGLDLHDHGGSRGVLAVVSGTLLETYTDREHHDSIRGRISTAGQVTSIPETRVHEVSNPGPVEAMSVHVYSPPLRSMTFYESGPAGSLTPLHTTTGDLAVLEEAAF